MTTSADAPHPPRNLASRVFRHVGWDNSDPYRAYDELGAQTKRALVGLLPDGWSFEGKRVLDFGSGAGRTLRHFLSEAEDAEFWGTDIDPASIEWLQDNLCPPLNAWQCSNSPPIGLEHGSFDLVWAVSVFTHLTDNSSSFLLELHRMLKPDGLLIATYMGRWNSEFFAREPWDENRIGRNVLRHEQTWDEGGPAVLMSDWWMRAHWGRAFEILEIVPQIHNMCWALMRKRDVELTTDDLEQPSDDPREFLALRHNLRQVQRDVTELARWEEQDRALREQELAEARAEIARVRDEYERSLSWRATRPLRAAAQRARSSRVRRSARDPGDEQAREKNA